MTFLKLGRSLGLLDDGLVETLSSHFGKKRVNWNIKTHAS